MKLSKVIKNKRKSFSKKKGYAKKNKSKTKSQKRKPRTRRFAKGMSNSFNEPKLLNNLKKREMLETTSSKGYNSLFGNTDSLYKPFNSILNFFQ